MADETRRGGRWRDGGPAGATKSLQSRRSRAGGPVTAQRDGAGSPRGERSEVDRPRGRRKSPQPRGHTHSRSPPPADFFVPDFLEPFIPGDPFTQPHCVTDADKNRLNVTRRRPVDACQSLLDQKPSCDHLVMSEVSWRRPSERQLKGDIEVLSKAISQHPTPVAPEGLNELRSKVELLERLSGALSRGVLGFADAGSTDVVGAAKQDTLIAWIMTALSVSQDTPHDHAVNVRYLKVGLLFARIVLSIANSTTIAERLLAAGLQKLICQLISSRFLCGSLLILATDVLDASLQTPAGAAMWCHSALGDGASGGFNVEKVLAYLDTASKFHPEGRLGALVERLRAMTRLWKSCTQFGNHVEAHLNALSSAVTAETGGSDFIDAQMKSLAAIIEAVEEGVYACSEGYNVDEKYHSRSHRMVQMSAFCYSTLAQSKFMKCVGVVILALDAQPLSDVVGDTLAVIARILLHFLKSRGGLILLAEASRMTQIAVAGLIGWQKQAMDPDHIPSLGLSLKLATHFDENLRVQCTRVHAGAIIGYHVEAFMIIHTLLCIDPVIAVTDPSPQLINILYSIETLCSSSFCGKSAYAYTAMLLDAVSWFVDYLRACELRTASTDNAESAKGTENRAVTVSQQLVVRALLYVFYDNESASTAAIYGIKLYNFTVKLRNLPWLSKILAQLKVFTEPSQYISAKLAETGLVQLAHRILETVRQQKDNRGDKTTSFPTIAVPIRLIFYAITTNEAAQIPAAFHAASNASCGALELICSVLHKESVVPNAILAKVLSAATPVLSLLRLLVRTSYDGGSLLGNVTSLFEHIISLYFKLWSTAKPYYSTSISKNPSVLEMRVLTVLDQLTEIIVLAITPDITESHLARGLDADDYQTTVSLCALRHLLQQVIVVPTRFEVGLQLFLRCMSPLEYHNHTFNDVDRWKVDYCRSTVIAAEDSIIHIAVAVACSPAESIQCIWHKILETLSETCPSVANSITRSMFQSMRAEWYNCDTDCIDEPPTELEHSQFAKIQNCMCTCIVLAAGDSFHQALRDGIDEDKRIENSNSVDEENSHNQRFLRDMAKQYSGLHEPMLIMYERVIGQFRHGHDNLTSTDIQIMQCIVEDVILISLSSAVLSTKCRAVWLLQDVYQQFLPTPQVSALFLGGQADLMWNKVCASFVEEPTPSEAPSNLIWLGRLSLLRFLCLLLKEHADCPSWGSVLVSLRGILEVGSDNGGFLVSLSNFLKRDFNSEYTALALSAIDQIQQTLLSEEYTDGDSEQRVALAVDLLRARSQATPNWAVAQPIPYSVSLNLFELIQRYGVQEGLPHIVSQGKEANAVIAQALAQPLSREKRQYSNIVETKGIGYQDVRVKKSRNSFATRQGAKDSFRSAFKANDSRKPSMHVDDFQSIDLQESSSSRTTQSQSQVAAGKVPAASVQSRLGGAAPFKSAAPVRHIRIVRRGKQKQH